MLLLANDLRALDWAGILLAAACFAWNHKLSYDRHVEADTAGRQSLTRMMLLPYLRVVPMHFTVMLGTGLASGRSQVSPTLVLIVFLVLKSGADIAMHRLEHRILQRTSA
jgi:hypothetical protein